MDFSLAKSKFASDLNNELVNNMNITYCTDYESMSIKAASFIISEINKNKELLLCPATGNSPVNLYRQLVNKSKLDRKFFENLRVLKLDEWGAVSENHPVSCEYYLRTRFLEQLGIPSERYISFSSNPKDPVAECKRIQSELDYEGPIDICILGLGKNGHIGFNEPAQFLHPNCHVADLSKETIQHSMVRSMGTKPEFGLTLGMQDILCAKKILLLITGKNKKSITERFLQRKVTTDLPASFLWLHNNVECVIDKNVMLD